MFGLSKKIRFTRTHRCAYCGNEFFYVITRKCTGKGFTSKKREEDLKKKTQFYLEREIKSHPCPNCGKYQPEMQVINFYKEAFRKIIFTFYIFGVAILVTCLELWRSVSDTSEMALRSVDFLENHLSVLLGPGCCIALALFLYIFSIIYFNKSGGKDQENTNFRKGFFYPCGILIAATFCFWATDIIFLISGFKFNPNTFPQYFGPGDTVYIKFPVDIYSLNKSWDGSLSVSCTTEDGRSSWNSTITSTDPIPSSISFPRKKGDHSPVTNKYQPALEGKMRIPDNQDLENKMFVCTIDGKVEYPSIAREGLRSYIDEEGNIHIYTRSGYQRADGYFKEAVSDVHSVMNCYLGRKKLGRDYLFTGYICALTGWILLLAFVFSLKGMAYLSSFSKQAQTYKSRTAVNEKDNFTSFLNE